MRVGCKDCQHAYGRSPYYECRRSSPVFSSYSTFGKWPIVSDDDFCAKFMNRIWDREGSDDE